jgi:hypothetical protein
MFSGHIISIAYLDLFSVNEILQTAVEGEIGQSGRLLLMTTLSILVFSAVTY